MTKLLKWSTRSFRPLFRRGVVQESCPLSFIVLRVGAGVMRLRHTEQIIVRPSDIHFDVTALAKAL